MGIGWKCKINIIGWKDHFSRSERDKVFDWWDQWIGLVKLRLTSAKA